MNKNWINHVAWVSLIVTLLLAAIFLPSMVHADYTNLAPINDGKWYPDEDWSAPCPTLNVFYETNASDMHNGALTWRVEPADSCIPTNWGPDHSLIAIEAGQHIVMTCWVKTAGAAGAYGTGARIGLDYYGTTGNGQVERIAGISSPAEAANGEGWPNTYSPDEQSPSIVIPWGTSTWTLIYWSFTVPKQAESDGFGGGLNNPSQGTWVMITGCIPWCQNWGANGFKDTYTAWYSDFQFYTNPTTATDSNATLSATNTTAGFVPPEYVYGVLAATIASVAAIAIFAASKKGIATEKKPEKISHET